MRVRCCYSLLTLIAFAAGCGAPLSGTWHALEKPGVDKPITAVTFCHDGTFTASADYGSGKVHAMSGCYQYSSEKLTLCTKDSTREYMARVDGDCLEITHEGKTQKLCRIKCMKGSCCVDAPECCKKL